MRGFLLALILAAPAAAKAPYGILLMAHGGDSSWNEEIARLRARVDAKVPTETALGMADPASLQAAVDRLEKRGAARIVAVPLFVQSRSEVMDQTRFVLRLSDKPSEVLRAAYAAMSVTHAGHAASGGHGGHGGHAAHAAHAAHGDAKPGAEAHRHAWSEERVKSRAPIALSAALDDSPLVARILRERAKGLSRDAAKEDLILVAHGPNDASALPAWAESLKSLCAAAGAGFRSCSSSILRDDAGPEIRGAAVADLRARVVRAKEGGGRAVVVPVLIARGGIERRIARDLEGLDCAWDGKTLMPHPGFEAWVLERAASASAGSR